MFKTILAANDGSHHAWRALDTACDLARQYGARLIVVGAYRHRTLPSTSHSLVQGREAVSPPDEELSRLTHELVESAVEHAKQHGVQQVEGIVRRGPPARMILEVAKQHDVDAIVMGSRGLTDIEGFLLGSVSHKASNLCDCTCITVKRGKGAGAEGG